MLRRRSFLASIAMAGLPVAAFKAKRKRKPSKLPLRARGIVVYIHTSEQPKTWREVPLTGTISERLAVLREIGSEQPLLSLDLARRLAKAFNRRPAIDRRGEWAIVVATDGRKDGAA